MKKDDLKAPDTEVTLADGSRKRLGDFWEDRTLVLVFLRHFGWPFCRKQAAQLRRDKERFENAGARVVLVGMGAPEASAAFREKFHIPFPIISDPDRKLYGAFALKRISPIQFFSPAVVLKGVSAMAQGHLMGLPRGDVRQLPGVFIIDRKGRIVYSHHAVDPSDHPDSEVLLQVIEKTGG